MLKYCRVTVTLYMWCYSNTVYAFKIRDIPSTPPGIDPHEPHQGYIFVLSTKGRMQINLNHYKNPIRIVEAPKKVLKKLFVIQIMVACQKLHLPRIFVYSKIQIF